jgi:histidinol dehydrogenase
LQGIIETQSCPRWQRFGHECLHRFADGRYGNVSTGFSTLHFDTLAASSDIIEYTTEQLAAAADDILRLAEVEGLDAHARSVALRRGT